MSAGLDRGEIPTPTNQLPNSPPALGILVSVEGNKAYSHLLEGKREALACLPVSTSRGLARGTVTVILTATHVAVAGHLREGLMLTIPDN